MPITRITNVIIVDDHPIVAQGLTTYLSQQPDIHVAGVASSVELAIALVSAARPNVVIIDLHLPCYDGAPTTFEPFGIQLIGKLRALFPHNIVRIIAITGSTNDILKTWSLKAGADAFLTKDSPPEEIIEIIHHLRATQCEISTTSLYETPFATLTERELQILYALTQGMPEEEISSQLDITHNTTKFHLKNIYQKLRISNRREAIKLVLCQMPQSYPAQLNVG